MFALVLLLGLTVCQVSAWSAWKPKHLPGFHLVKKLPKTMVAGETVEWQVSLVNPKSENGLLNITLEITEQHGIGLKEFKVEGTLETYDNPPRKHYYPSITFTEKTEGGIGIFQSLQTPIGERFNIIKLKICSVPNLMQGTYTFTLTVTLQYEE